MLIFGGVPNTALPEEVHEICFFCVQEIGFKIAETHLYKCLICLDMLPIFWRGSWKKQLELLIAFLSSSGVYTSLSSNWFLVINSCSLCIIGVINVGHEIPVFCFCFFEIGF